MLRDIDKSALLPQAGAVVTSSCKTVIPDGMEIWMPQSVGDVLGVAGQRQDDFRYYTKGALDGNFLLFTLIHNKKERFNFVFCANHKQHRYGNCRYAVADVSDVVPDDVRSLANAVAHFLVPQMPYAKAH